MFLAATMTPTQPVFQNSHFGDINFVSGKPFPLLSAQPKWVRFRVLSAAVSRPWLLQFVDNDGAEVGSKICHVRDANDDDAARMFLMLILNTGA
jgi:hypothetical protein